MPGRNFKLGVQARLRGMSYSRLTEDGIEKSVSRRAIEAARRGWQSMDEYLHMQDALRLHVEPRPDTQPKEEKPDV